MGMAWEHIEERMQVAFSTKIPFPHGAVWVPDTRLNIDDWLTSTALTEEELRELEIPRFQFLQNRWPIEKLLGFEWEDRLFPKHIIWNMQVQNRAYIFLSDGLEHQVVAAIAPNTEPPLFQAVVTNLLKHTEFIPPRPTVIRNYRPDLLPEAFIADLLKRRDLGAEFVQHAQSPFEQKKRQRGYLAQLLFGWIGGWFGLPEVGYYHDLPAENKNKDAA